MGQIRYRYGDGAHDVRATVPDDGGCGRAIQPTDHEWRKLRAQLLRRFRAHSCIQCRLRHQELAQPKSDWIVRDCISRYHIRQWILQLGAIPAARTTGTTHHGGIRHDATERQELPLRQDMVLCGASDGCGMGVFQGRQPRAALISQSELKELS